MDTELNQNSDLLDSADRTPIEIKPDQLSSEILNAIIEEFIQREGTDYGNHEVSLDLKTQQIKKQLHKNEILIVFDPTTESVNLMTKSEFSKRIKYL